MNDVFSPSFREYLQDDKRQIHANDIEAGTGGEGNETTIDLDKFFEDVEKVEEDMKDVDRLYKKLQGLNEESKRVHNAQTMKEVRARMDADVGEVLKMVRVIKGKLEALDRANVAHRSIPECGPRSSVNRTRTSVVCGLGKKLKVIMNEFQALRTKISSEYMETIEKRYSYQNRNFIFIRSTSLKFSLFQNIFLQSYDKIVLKQLNPGVGGSDTCHPMSKKNREKKCKSAQKHSLNCEKLFSFSVQFNRKFVLFQKFLWNLV